MTYSLTPSKKIIDLSDIPLGIYLMTLQTDDGKEKMAKK